MSSSSVIKSWVFTNSTDYAKGGKLFLGQVLTDPLNPQSALISGKPKALPAELYKETTDTVKPLITSQNILTRSARLWLDTYCKAAGVSVKYESLETAESNWEVDRLTKDLTTLSLQYVKGTALQEADVQAWIQSRLSLLPPTLYIITGLRILSGAKLVSTKQTELCVGGRVEADGTPAQAPVSGGAEAATTHAEKSTHSFQETSDFVFAYQVNQINTFIKIRIRPFKTGHTDSASPAIPADEGRGSSDSGGTSESRYLDVDVECPVAAEEFGTDENIVRELGALTDEPDERYFFAEADKGR